MHTEKMIHLIGRHSFIAYEGDIEWIERDGVMVRANPIVFKSPVYKNLITTVGKQALLDRLAGLSAVAAFVNVGVGTDSTAAAVGQTQLNPSVSGSVLLQACDSTFPSRASLVLTYTSTFGTGVANFAWNESAVFNGTTNGTSLMFNRAVIGPFTKSSAVSIVATITITQS